MSDVELLSNRVRALENRFQWIKILSLIACIVIAALGAMGQARGIPGEVLPRERPLVETRGRSTAAVEEEVRSRHFILVDESGKERASLAADNAGSVFLTMFDAA